MGYPVCLNRDTTNLNLCTYVRICSWIWLVVETQSSRLNSLICLSCLYKYNVYQNCNCHYRHIFVAMEFENLHNIKMGRRNINVQHYKKKVNEKSSEIFVQCLKLSRTYCSIEKVQLVVLNGNRKRCLTDQEKKDTSGINHNWSGGQKLISWPKQSLL